MRNITGKMIYYYFVCKRKLWYFVNYVEMESESELVDIGLAVHENTFLRSKHDIDIPGGGSADFIEDPKIIHEVKKGRSIEEADIWQIKYYLYCLAKKGIENPKGELHYIEEHTTQEVLLEEGDIEKIDEIITKIGEICTGEIESYKRIPICKSCAYYELCAI